MRASDVCDPIRHGTHCLDLFDLYARMWDLGEDLGDGTRLFRPRPGHREALKWLVEDLSGAVAHPSKKLPANNAIRRQVHQRLEERGWATRVTQMSFVLRRNPAAPVVDAPLGETTPIDASPGTDLDDHNDSGEQIDGVGVHDVSGHGRLGLAGLGWSDWSPLEQAALMATTEPGVYAARSGPDLVYIGMAGERRGSGVRGRLRIYARGRGAVSGLGEAALDRALGDAGWLEARLASLRADGPARTKQWAVEALRRAELQVAWAAAPDAETARRWELDCLVALEDAALWNRARPRKGDS